MQRASNDLNALADLWLSVHRIHDTIAALGQDAERIGRAIDALNGDRFTTAEIEEAAAAIK